MDHRVISLWQPWASLLAGGIKTIETRSWPTGWRGLLFVHAGKLANDLTTAVGSRWESELHGLHPASQRPTHLHMPRGGIVGVVRLVDCMPVEELPAELLTSAELDLGDYSVDRFGWVCARPVLFRTLVPCRGQQGLFCLGETTLAECIAAWRVSAAAIDQPEEYGS